MSEVLLYMRFLMSEVPLYQALRSYEDVTERIEEALLAQVLLLLLYYSPA